MTGSGKARAAARLGLAPLFLAAFASVDCGSRSTLLEGEDPRTPCVSDPDCGPPDACGLFVCAARFCVRRELDCDDGDPCTEDRCSSSAGCVHRELTRDEDGDGHNKPRPGFDPDDAQSCGDDCDDTNKNVYPGNTETCDAVDNDCNGIVDDRAQYRLSSTPPVRVTGMENKRADCSSLLAVGDSFVAACDGRQGTIRRSFLVGLSASGNKLFETFVSDINAESYAGTLAWSGTELWTAWDDARDAQFDVFLARFNSFGDKLAPSTRISNARGFSLHPDVRFTGSEFVVVWDDRRGEEDVTGDFSRIFAQRVDVTGQPIGRNQVLIANDPVPENPALAVNGKAFGVAYTSMRQEVLSDPRLGFRTFSNTLEPLGSAALFSSEAHGPSTYWLQDRYVVLWSEYKDQTGPGSNLFAASFSPSAQPIVAPRSIVSGPARRHPPQAVSLGDRLLVVWSELVGDQYDLFWQVLDADLQTLSPPQRITSTADETLSPTLAIGPGGRVGLLYNDATPTQSMQAYFTTFECRPQ